MRLSHRVPAIAVLLAAFVLAGCGRSSFLGRQFDDLTARFNTHYNADQTFKAQERRLKREDEPVDLDRYLLTFEIPTVSGRSAEFEKVIEKSADLLRKHPESKWVDDALMLIGKSYFYQSNYVGAEQKFNEVIALGSGLHDEALFWQARTLVASQSQEAAEDLIRTALASEDLDDKWRPRLHLLLGDLRTDFQDWEGAVAALETGLPEMDDGDLAARGRFLLAQLYETMGDYSGAIESYREVRRYKPLYELAYASMISQYRLEGLHGDPDLALKELDKMARDNKHFQYLDRIENMKGRVHAAKGDPFAARRMYYDILNPPPGRPQTAIRGEVHYRMGELYRDLIGDFHLAAAHFDTAASALRTTTLQNEMYTPDAIVNARETADVFSTYRQVSRQVHEMDSLLYLGTLDDDEFDEAVRKVREALAVEAARVAAELERRQTRSSFQRAAVTEAGGGIAQNTQFGSGSQPGRFGFLNHKDIQLVQEAYLNFRRTWGDRPLVPGWRREEVVLSTRSEQQDELDKAASPVQSQSIPGLPMSFLPPVDISAVPRDSISQVKMRSERAAARYKLANVLFLQAGLPDSAAYWYRLVIDQDSTEPVAIRAEYAMAEIHLALGDELAAERLLEQIIREHPDTDFADRARVTLGMSQRQLAPDSTEVAVAEYEEAYGYWQRGDLDAAMNAMMRTAADNPRLDIGAKALLASAAIYTEMARVDSLDLFGVIPIPDSLFTPDEVAAARHAAGDTVDTASSPDSLASDSLSPGAALLALNEDSLALGTENVIVATGVDSVALPTPDSLAEDPIPQLPELAIADDSATVEEELVPDRPPTGESLELDDDILRRRAIASADSIRMGGDDDDLLVRRNVVDEEPVDDERIMPVDDAPVVEASDMPVAVASDSASASDSTLTTAGLVDPDSLNVADDTPEMPPAPEKPEWISARYHINGIVPQPVTLHAIYTTVEQSFRNTEYGEHAAQLKRGLTAYRDELFAPPADTTMQPSQIGSVDANRAAPQIQSDL